MNSATRPLVTVVTRSVANTLDRSELADVVDRLLKAKEIPDPENPGLWSVAFGAQTVWGVLDEGAGPEGQDLFTIMFPDDY